MRTIILKNYKGAYMMNRSILKWTDSFYSKKGMMKDSITTGLLAGLIGTTLMEISNLLIFKAGKTETLYGHIAGGLFFAPYKTKKRKYFVLGELAHFAIGSIWGIPLTYLLKKTGKDHHLVKGILISIFSLGTLVGGQKLGVLKKFGLAKTFYSAIWNHLVYGIVTVQAIIWLSDPIIFKSASDEARLKTSRQTKTNVKHLNFIGSSREVNNNNQNHSILH